MDPKRTGVTPRATGGDPGKSGLPRYHPKNRMAKPDVSPKKAKRDRAGAQRFMTGIVLLVAGWGLLIPMMLQIESRQMDQAIRIGLWGAAILTPMIMAGKFISGGGSKKKK